MHNTSETTIEEQAQPGLSPAQESCQGAHAEFIKSQLECILGSLGYGSYKEFVTDYKAGRVPPEIFEDAVLRAEDIRGKMTLPEFSRCYFPDESNFKLRDHYEPRVLEGDQLGNVTKMRVLPNGDILVATRDKIPNSNNYLGWVHILEIQDARVTKESVHSGLGTVTLLEPTFGGGFVAVTEGENSSEIIKFNPTSEGNYTAGRTCSNLKDADTGFPIKAINRLFTLPDGSYLFGTDGDDVYVLMPLDTTLCYKFDLAGNNKLLQL